MWKCGTGEYDPSRELVRHSPAKVHPDCDRSRRCAGEGEDLAIVVSPPIGQDVHRSDGQQSSEQYECRRNYSALSLHLRASLPADPPLVRIVDQTAQMASLPSCRVDQLRTRPERGHPCPCRDAEPVNDPGRAVASWLSTRSGRCRHLHRHFKYQTLTVSLSHSSSTRRTGLRLPHGTPGRPKQARVRRGIPATLERSAEPARLSIRRSPTTPASSL